MLFEETVDQYIFYTNANVTSEFVKTYSVSALHTSYIFLFYNEPNLVKSCNW